MAKVLHHCDRVPDNGHVHLSGGRTEHCHRPDSCRLLSRICGGQHAHVICDPQSCLLLHDNITVAWHREPHLGALANKWGRRPVYVLSYLIYFAASVWLIFDKSYGGFLAGRILMGFGAGAAETIAPVSIVDLFFLHERGRIMSAYTGFLSIGVAAGIIISGLITINHSWRTIYEVAPP